MGCVSPVIVTGADWPLLVYFVEILFTEKQTRMRVACFRFLRVNLDSAYLWCAKIRQKQGDSAQNGVFQQNTNHC